MNVAASPNEPPALPMRFGPAGREIAHAHSFVYQKLVMDARRALTTHEAISRTAECDRTVRDDIEVLKKLRKDLKDQQRSATPNLPSDDDSSVETWLTITGKGKEKAT